jgi:DNA repair protein RecO (recombination protein O)
MQWEDQAIILKKYPFGEHSCIVTVLSKEHGLHKGLLKRGKFMQGDVVKAAWYARLPEQLGIWSFHGENSFAPFFMRNKTLLACFLFVCELLPALLSERTPYPSIFYEFLAFWEKNASLSSGSLLLLPFHYWLFELFLLEKIGFGLDFQDLSQETSDDPLFYVSPKTGRVVTRSVGYPYRQQLLLFPQCFQNVEPFLQDPSAFRQELQKGLAVTEFFLFQKTLPLGEADPLHKKRQYMISLIFEVFQEASLNAP